MLLPKNFPRLLSNFQDFSRKKQNSLTWQAPCNALKDKISKNYKKRILISIWNDHAETIANSSENLSKNIDTCQLFKVQVSLTTWLLTTTLKSPEFTPIGRVKVPIFKYFVTINITMCLQFKFEVTLMLAKSTLDP